MFLKEIIERLESSDLSKIVRIGFTNPHSYRGDYSQLGLEISENITVECMLNSLKRALNSTYHGWKGGEYEMDEFVYCYLVQSEGCTGEQIGSVMLTYMLEEDYSRENY